MSRVNQLCSEVYDVYKKIRVQQCIIKYYYFHFIPSGVSGLSHPALRPQFGPNVLFLFTQNNNHHSTNIVYCIETVPYLHNR